MYITPSGHYEQIIMFEPEVYDYFTYMLDFVASNT